MGERIWPPDWEARRAGKACRGCQEWQAEDIYGIRYLTSDYADAYLQRRCPAPGYSVVRFRGRHVADPSELRADETLGFWSGVRRATSAIEAVFSPCHFNYQILGNEMPHLHVHVVPRYLHDPFPERPISTLAWDQAIPLADEELAQQAEALRDAVGR